jgi:hypothetical protein
MDKPAKDNTISEVVNRVTKTFETIDSVNPESTTAIMAGFVNFFGPYNIDYPTQWKDEVAVQRSLEATLEKDKQPAIDAIERMTRLGSKTHHQSFEYTSPVPSVLGALELLEGLPITQLRSTHNKNYVDVDQRTFPDRVSKLISFAKPHEGEENLMITLLSSGLPQSARVARHNNRHMEFLDTSMAYIRNELEPYSKFLQGLPYFPSIVNQLERLAQPLANVKLTAPDRNLLKARLTQTMLEQIAESSNPRAALTELLGYTVLGVDATGHHSGVNRQIEIYVANDGRAPVKATVFYGSTAIPKKVSDALCSIADECVKGRKPTDLLYLQNMHAKSTLPNLSR